MSDLGSLSECMLESNAESLSAGRVLRRKALTLSIVLECAVLSVLVLDPLLYPGVLPNILARTPAPPYRHFADVFVSEAPLAPSGPSTTSNPTRSLLAQQPAHIPSRVFSGAIPDAPGSPSALGPEIPGTPGLGDRGVPFSFGPGAPPALKPPVEKRDKPVNVSQGVMEAMLINKVTPVYPAPARAIRLSGEVVLHAVIGADGTVRQLQVLSGNPLLVQAAVVAVRQWRYRPTMLSGEPVEVNTTITVKFVLGTE
jgi:periplasmic protein TonB